MIVRLLPIVMAASLVSAPAAAADPVLLHAAGSLRLAFTDMSTAFAAATGLSVQAKYGASGLLKDEIMAGAKAEVFASANMEHPQALSAAGRSGPVTAFARNRLCALVRPGLSVGSSDLLAVMLNPNVKLGTSTPHHDPSGDYAWDLFRKAEAIKPGARTILEKKARQLTGSAKSGVPPAGKNVYGWHVAEQNADIFITYCTNAQAAKKQYPDQQIIILPEKLMLGADYGLTVIRGSSPVAEAFADFIVSPQGEQILASYGFSPGTSP